MTKTKHRFTKEQNTTLNRVITKISFLSCLQSTNNSSIQKLMFGPCGH